MKKLISCLLVVMMLLTVVSAFAESSGTGRFGENNFLIKFLKETDYQTKDIALQTQSGDQVTDLVIRIDNDNLHLVSRDGDVENSHIQLNSEGIYVGSADSVTLLRYTTISTVMQNVANAVSSVLEEVVNSLPDVPEEDVPTEAELKVALAEIKEAVDELAILASAEEEQEQADAATLTSAALSFVGKFKPEYILDVKEEEGSVQIALRSEAFATALAEAMDELMSNPDLAELVDRKAEEEGGKDFSRYQKQWIRHRDATLDAIRSIESTQTIEDNGHCVSHFQIGEELSETKILMCDTESWTDAENGDMYLTVCLGFKNEDPLVVYEFSMDQYSYYEKLTAGDSMAEVKLNYEDNQITDGTVLVVMEDKEELRAGFGQEYFYMKGPKGGISTSVRETWTGKIRFEIVAENDEGKESTIILDFYEDGDSLICELNTSESDQSAMFKISRIDKVDIKDLSAAENINEITVEKINAELDALLKLIAKTDK